MKKTINLGYVQIPNENKRRKAKIEVEITTTKEGRICLAICGEITNYSYGQCIGEIKKYIVKKRKNFDRIMEIWEKYHLNNMHAGTERQEQAVREYCKDNRYDYNKICEYLKEKGIYIDNGYRYGTSWLYRPIPESVLDEIFTW